MPWGMAFLNAPSVSVTGVDVTATQATVHVTWSGQGGAPIKIDYVAIPNGNQVLVDNIIYVQYPNSTSTPSSVYQAHWNCH